MTGRQTHQSIAMTVKKMLLISNSYYIVMAWHSFDKPFFLCITSLYMLDSGVSKKGNRIKENIKRIGELKKVCAVSMWFKKEEANVTQFAQMVQERGIKGNTVCSYGSRKRNQR